MKLNDINNHKGPLWIIENATVKRIDDWYFDGYIIINRNTNKKYNFYEVFSTEQACIETLIHETEIVINNCKKIIENNKRRLEEINIYIDKGI